MLVVGVLGVFVAVVACRIGSVVGLTVGGVVLRLGVSVRVLGRILVGLVRVRLVLVGLTVTVLIGLVSVGVVGRELEADWPRGRWSRQRAWY